MAWRIKVVSSSKVSETNSFSVEPKILYTNGWSICLSMVLVEYNAVHKIVINKIKYGKGDF